ncbi:MAG: ATP synthase F0 subunit C [bacterium]|nr:ATP synthase F0 subunit C [bacterium]
MEPESIRLLASVAAIAIGTVAPAIAVAIIGSRGVRAIGRNPEAAPKIQTAMVLAISFAEAIAIYSLVVSLVIKFVD